MTQLIIISLNTNMEQYNAGIDTGFVIGDDSVHFSVDGQSIWNGNLEAISGTTRLREHIAELSKPTPKEVEES